MLEAIRASNAAPLSREDYLRRYNQFSEFLRECAPAVAYWHQVDQLLIARYLDWSRAQGLQYDTIRLKMAIIRLTSKHMARIYPGRYKHVMEGIVLRRHAISKADLDMEEAVLSPTQLKGLLTWLKERDPRVYVWSMLQALCGLRLLEAAYLREQDFDPKHKTIRTCARWHGRRCG